MKKSIFLIFFSLSAILLLTNFNTKNTRPLPVFQPSQTAQQAFTALAMCTGGSSFMLDDFYLQRAPLFSNMGSFGYKVSTRSELAQKYFDQGLKLTYGFNHSEAERSFTEATKIDPNFAMAYWGKALALGPNINDPAPDKERERKAWEAIVQAQALSKMVSQKEEDFIDALAIRYMADTTKLNRDSLNEVYMKAMATLSKKYSEDTEILTLFAASIMNTMPWDYYDKSKKEKKNTAQAVEALERVMKLNNEHPGAHHYYIHIVEASKNPDRGVPSADKLGELVPASGHLVHMPSHIYARVGRYEDAANSNIEAIEADENYIAQCQAQGVYPLGYYPHNIHFLWMSASFQGKKEQSLNAAEKVANRVPIGMATNMTFLQEFLAVPLQAYVRFGQWNDILTTPTPAEGLEQYRVFSHYARSIAFTRKGLFDKAKAEIEALDELNETRQAKAEEVTPEVQKEMSTRDSMYARVPKNMYTITKNISAAELAAAKGKHDKAIELLKEAVLAEDDLPYSEPPIWHQPVRHVLGAILVEAERYEEAVQVYEEDLLHNRDNGWSLFGLHQSLKALGNNEDAKRIKVKFDKAWKDADVELTSSRF
ncbi:MAG: hypothetical protein AAFO07_05870 [Bacteroidota bacterium]